MGSNDDIFDGDAGRSNAAAPARGRRRDVSAPIVRRPKRQLAERAVLPAPSREAHAAGYSDFLPVAQQIILTPPSRFRGYLGVVICGLVTAALVWAVFGRLTIFAIAPGSFVARGGTQIVQTREAGQVSVLPVKNGDHVSKGSLVLQLDPTSAQAAETIVEAKLGNARAEAIRRHVAAEAAQQSTINAGTPVSWPDTVPADVRVREESVLRADLMQLAATIADLQSQLATALSSREKYVANIKAQKVLIDSRTKRTAMHEKLAEQGWDSRAMVLQSLEPLREDQVSLATYEGSLAEEDAAIEVIKTNIKKARDAFTAENANAAIVAERSVEDLVQQLTKARLDVANLRLRAPVSGVVQSLAVTNIGQAIKVGEQLMQIVPDGAPLQVEAYVLNNDIGFVKTGQPVTLKVDTFPFTRYGTIKGRVIRVGADAMTGDLALMQQKNGAVAPSKGALSATNPTQQTSDLVFPVTIVPEQTTIMVDGRAVPLTPGMSVVAEIETERQRGISYVLYPVEKAFRARY